MHFIHRQNAASHVVPLKTKGQYAQRGETVGMVLVADRRYRKCKGMCMADDAAAGTDQQRLACSSGRFACCIISGRALKAGRVTTSWDTARGHQRTAARKRINPAVDVVDRVGDVLSIRVNPACAPSRMRGDLPWCRNSGLLARHVARAKR